MNFIRNEWAKTNKKLILVLGIVFAVGAVIAMLSVTGVIDFSPVQTGVTSIKK
jgi:hypothetical protein